MPVGTRAHLQVHSNGHPSLALDVIVRRRIEEPNFKGLGVEFVDVKLETKEALMALLGRWRRTTRSSSTATTWACTDDARARRAQRAPSTRLSTVTVLASFGFVTITPTPSRYCGASRSPLRRP